MKSTLRINPQLGMLEALEAGRLINRKLTVTTNNLANVDTPGYKQDGLEFREVLMHKIGPKWKRIFKETVEYTDFSEGTVVHTGNPLDLAICGEGFFKVQTPNGIAYTRAGNFKINSQRVLVTAQGYPVLANGAPIIVDPGMVGLTTMQDVRINVSPTGIISIGNVPIGKLDIVSFDNLKKLKKIGENLFVAKGAREIPATNYEIKQGYLEMSNVNIVKEMVKLIEVQRHFQSLQKSITSIDEANTRLIETASR